jgi:DNA polymerase-3 subunit alpha
MKLAFDGVLERKIPREEWYETFKRLDLEMFELIGISKAKDAVVSSYFINTHKMLDIFWNEAECMTGCSRGSAAGWVLNYLLQICHQNPLKQPMEMPHWRFISAERPDYPKL